MTRKKHALVTGATGFIGSNLVRRLLEQNYSVGCLVRSQRKTSALPVEEVEIVYGSLPDCSTLEEQIRKADRIFHVAGITKSINPAGYYHGNQYSTKELVRTICQYGPPGQKLIYISSQSAGGPSADEPGIDELSEESLPVSVYGKSKKAAEQELLSLDDQHPYVVLRPSIVYGPADLGMLPLFKAARWGILIKIGARTFPVNTVNVYDCIKAALLAAESARANGKTYFITDCQSYSWNKLNNHIAASVNPKARQITIPLTATKFLCYFNCLIGRLTRRPVYLNPDKWQEIKQEGWLCNSSRIREELGFRPRYSLKEGLLMTADWYFQNNWL